MEKFFIVQFNDGHTSPSLDTFEEVVGYISEYATEAFWNTSNRRKNPVINIQRKQRAIVDPNNPTRHQIKVAAQHAAYQARTAAAT